MVAVRRLNWIKNRLCGDLLLLIWSQLLLLASASEPRELRPVSSSQLASLVTARDPGQAFDLKNSNSHLSKILIPRPRMSLFRTNAIWLNLGPDS